MSSRASSQPSNASRPGSAQTGYGLGRPSASGPNVASQASRIFRNRSASASSIISRSMHRASSPNRPIIGYRATVSIGSINVVRELGLGDVDALRQLPLPVTQPQQQPVEHRAPEPPDHQRRSHHRDVVGQALVDCLVRDRRAQVETLS